MNETPDHELLRRYADHGAEEAFTELVKRLPTVKLVQTPSAGTDLFDKVELAKTSDFLDFPAASSTDTSSFSVEGESLVDTMSTANTLTSGLDCTSPESIMEPANRTPAGDQYSLGCVLYYCLTGRVPFPEGSAVEKMMAHQMKEPVPVRDFAPECPDGLAAVLDFQHLPHLRLRPVAAADLVQGAGDGPHHVVQEPVRLHLDVNRLVVPGPATTAICASVPKITMSPFCTAPLVNSRCKKTLIMRVWISLTLSAVFPVPHR